MVFSIVFRIYFKDSILSNKIRHAPIIVPTSKIPTGEIPNSIPTYFYIEDNKGETVELMYLQNLDVIFCQKIVNQLPQETKELITKE